MDPRKEINFVLMGITAAGIILPAVEGVAF